MPGTEEGQVEGQVRDRRQDGEGTRKILHHEGTLAEATEARHQGEIQEDTQDRMNKEGHHFREHRQVTQVRIATTGNRPRIPIQWRGIILMEPYPVLQGERMMI